jgi:hypothetical protein
MAQSSDKDDFIARMKAENIELVLRYTDDGRIYGATYIDHNTRTVLNGSRLGKEFSANALEIIRKINRLSRRKVTLKIIVRLLTIVGISLMEKGAIPVALHPTINPTDMGRLHNPRPYKAIRTVMMTLPCSTGLEVCSLSARLSMHRRRPSTARCNGARRKSVVAPNYKPSNQNIDESTRR